jgi:4-hydroxy-L-threonine phosphate dehydrogenase PdxA
LDTVFHHAVTWHRFDIVGKGVANLSATETAIRLAAKLVSDRKATLATRSLNIVAH